MPLDSQGAVAHVKHFHLLQPFFQSSNIWVMLGRHGGKKYTELLVSLKTEWTITF